MLKFHYTPDSNIRINDGIEPEYWDTFDNFLADAGINPNFQLPEQVIEIRISDTLATVHTRNKQLPVPQGVQNKVDQIIGNLATLNAAKVARLEALENPE